MSVAVPGVKQNRDVVIPVKEDEALLAEHDEDGVSQLWKFAQDEQPAPKPADTFVEDRVTHGCLPPVCPDEGETVGNEADCADPTEDGQHEGPCGQGILEVVAGSILHPRLKAEDHNNVNCTGRERQGPVIFKPGYLILVVERFLKCENGGMVRIQSRRSIHWFHP